MGAFSRLDRFYAKVTLYTVCIYLLELVWGFVFISFLCNVCLFKESREVVVVALSVTKNIMCNYIFGGVRIFFLKKVITGLFLYCE